MYNLNGSQAYLVYYLWTTGITEKISLTLLRQQTISVGRGINACRIPLAWRLAGSILSPS